MTLSAVCFDLDDTLFDYHQYARAGLQSAADRIEAETGRHLHDELRRLYFEESVTEGTFDVLLERYDLEVPVAALVEAFHDSTGDLDPYPGAESVLEALGREFDLGLLTGGRGGHAKVDRLGIRKHFDAVLVAPSEGLTKHEREAYDRVLADLDVEPVAAAYVGDDPRVDFVIPNELGMTTVRVRRGRYADLDPEGPDAAPDHELDSLDELLTDVPGLAESSHLD
jgi:putative hydrolase of the HAD superfamily